MKIEELLELYFGYKSFRTGQKEVISAVLNGRDVICIMPTGGGKSVCYQLPAIVSEGTAIVVSPLISLMNDQALALKNMGVKCGVINSSMRDNEYKSTYSEAVKGAYKILYVAPERLFTKDFLFLVSRIKISFVAVDEAHCVSRWGQDFRPDYLKIADFIEALSERPPVIALTATATTVVKDDIKRMLNLYKPFELVTGFDRPNLYFEVKESVNKMKDLVDLLQKFRDSSGVVYCATRKLVDSVTTSLVKKGFNAVKYHGGMNSISRSRSQNAFIKDESNIMVATNAFGMGIDKSNVYYVIHYNMPGSIESYYQEAGRAGRDGLFCECILLFSKRDIGLNRYLIEKSPGNPNYSEEEKNKFRNEELGRLKSMTDFVKEKGCKRDYILRYFGEQGINACNKCSSCNPDYKRKSILPVSEFDKSFEENLLFDVLKKKRMELAKRDGVPAYIVFSDAVLRDICRKKPIDRVEFLKISGVGKVKLERYGEDFIEAIRTYMSD